MHPAAEKLCPISITGDWEGDPFVLYKFIGIVEIGNKIHKDYQEILIKTMGSGLSHILFLRMSVIVNGL